MVVERYSHVLHLVSQVDGELRDGLTAMDAFRASFPAGTLTGAPKVRAMQIIDEMEPEQRGPYGGAVGYISAGVKRMDLAITIRTCVIANGVASVQSAAGVVYDSDSGSRVPGAREQGAGAFNRNRANPPLGFARETVVGHISRQCDTS